VRGGGGSSLCLLDVCREEKTMIEVITKIILNSIKDEGRSFEIGLQDQVSNHLIVMDIKYVLA